MFNGFQKEARDFFIGMQLNNNETYYREHLEEYERLVKKPMRDLNEALSQVVHDMDPDLDTRPGSVISRLRRDTRFTKDKSPFRDHVWMGWRYPGERRSEGFHMYWGFGAQWMGWGCGSYGTDRPLMDAFRERILNAPDQVREVFRNRGLARRYTISGESYKKMTVPDAVPEDLKGLYALKYLEVNRDGTAEEWELMKTPDFVGRMIDEINTMAPLLQLMKALRKGIQPAPMEAPQPEVSLNNSNPTGKIVVRTADEFEF